MFRLDTPRSVPFCNGLNRRDFLHAGSLACLNLSLPDLCSLQARGAVDKNRDVNCIFLFLVGGPSQIDTWDMKPDAPSEIRGPYKPIPTNVPGIQISELFPRMARHANSYALVRSFHHKVNAHPLAHYLVQTGQTFSPGIVYPNLGCTAGFLKGTKSNLPPHLLLPIPLASRKGQSAGFLGQNHNPFLIHSDPSKTTFQVQNLVPPGYVSALRVQRAKSFRKVVDKAFQNFEKSSSSKTGLMDSAYNQAYSIISSARARAAFDLGNEEDQLRDRYGQNRFGQSCLLARRLIEAGVRFVTVNMFDDFGGGLSWDVHGSSPFSPITELDTLGPMFDNAYTSLIEDLHDRNLLQQTLVVAMGEFGRTPRINPAGGRDHWPSVATILFAGGGIEGGQVVGSSDRIGGEPRDRPVSPEEVLATIYKALGISLHTELPGPQNRPIPIVDIGIKPIQELFGSS